MSVRLVTRTEWGARAPSSPIEMTTWSRRIGVAFHYEGDVPATPRQIQDYSMDSRGYRDIMYNALVDRAGVAYEGRQGGWLAVAAHALNQNTPYIGICFLGRDEDVTAAALNTMGLLYADLCALKGSSLLARGHRDLPGQSTDCPGAQIERWLAAGMPVTDTSEDEVAMTKNVQQALKDAGFDPGPVDGVWGPRTQAAFTAMCTAANDRNITGVDLLIEGPVAAHAVVNRG